jgi:hypothetical protein
MAESPSYQRVDLIPCNGCRVAASQDDRRVAASAITRDRARSASMRGRVGGPAPARPPTPQGRRRAFQTAPPAPDERQCRSRTAPTQPHRNAPRHATAPTYAPGATFSEASQASPPMEGADIPRRHRHGRELSMPIVIAPCPRFSGRWIKAARATRAVRLHPRPSRDLDNRPVNQSPPPPSPRLPSGSE